MTSNAKRLALPLGFALLHALIGVVSVSNEAFFGAFGWIALTGHHEIFFRYASEAMAGHVPYRDYLVEYPILSFPLMMIPRFFASTLPGYTIAYVAMLLGFNAVTVWMVARRVERDEGLDAVAAHLGWYTMFFVALCPLLLCPFDLAPTCLAFVAACWWSSGRAISGGTMAGLGALMKIFPGAVAIPAIVIELSQLRRTKGRGIVAFAMTSTLGIAAWFAIGGRGVLNSLGYHAERGLEVESTWAGLIYLYGSITGRVVTSSYDHAATHITSDWGATLASLAVPTQLALFALVAWRFHRSGMREPIRYSTAAILGFIVGGKVLSPQFMIWLVPFVATIGGPMKSRARWAFAACCLLSSMSFPWGGLMFLVNGYVWAILLINLRNALLIYLLAILVVGPAAAKETAKGVA